MSDMLLRILLSSLFLTLAGAAAERALRDMGRPFRGVWILTMAATMATTMLLAAGGSLPLSAPDAMTRMASLTNPADSGTLVAESGRGSLDYAVIAWVVLTALLLVTLAFCSVLQKRRLNGGVSARIDGVMVLLTDRFGPAVAGVLHPVIVVPAWLMELPQRQRRLVVRHEAEHAAAGDQRLAAVALVICCLIPWNPFVWLHFHRLRLAIEIDCDARVLRRERGARGDYGRLLIDVAERMARGTPLVTALVYPRSSLERRIRMITRRTARPAYAAAWALGALIMIAGACMEPSAPRDPGGQFIVSEAKVDSAGQGTTLRPLDRATAEAKFTFRTPVGDRELSISGNRLVRFRARVDSDGRATDVIFAPGTPTELRPLARKSIGSVRFHTRDAADASSEWIPAIVTVPTR
jgi:hypothetical protein